MEAKKQPKTAAAVDSFDPRELEIVKEIDEKLKFLLSSRANACDMEDLQGELDAMRKKFAEEEERHHQHEIKWKTSVEDLAESVFRIQTRLDEQTRSNAKLIQEKAADKKIIEKLQKELEETRKDQDSENFPFRKKLYEMVKKSWEDGDQIKEAEKELGVANRHFLALKGQAEKDVKMLREKTVELEKALHKAKTDLGRARAERNAAKKTIEEMEKKVGWA
ncbi:hypothetical protein CAEBREN_14868 [Caenorhabditis brenneri]|uniref:Uncharacterized protein n=1 Tax=Caenorhabditis brenneri TaxID=135651 RepID=G0P3R4_CAEBE|nr:hypothetical protein CAEBREN_14868 [Caenorhabditis brenneri]